MRMRRIRAACCARAASGHAAAALPTNVMTSRRCMCPPSSGDSILTSIGAEIDFKPLPQRKANVADGVKKRHCRTRYSSLAASWSERAPSAARGSKRRSVDLDQESANPASPSNRSEEHMSELQSPDHLVCRLLLKKKKTQPDTSTYLTLSRTL